jgi:hypothetical protein
MQRQFTYGNATITLHRSRNADELDSELITSILMGEGERPIRDWHRARRYADMLVSVDAVEGDAGVLIPAADAPADALRAGFEAWLNEAGLYRAWKAAYAQVNAPVGDADTSPAADPKG